MSKCIIIAGGTGSGKTTLVKKYIATSKRKKLIYDVNNEYGYPYVKMDDFLRSAIKAENSLIVFEEATIFFRTSGVDNELREMLVRKRHTNNVFLFNFHSLSQVPLEILMFCDYFIIKKTNDQISQMERKYRGNLPIFKAFQEVHNSPNRFATKRLKLQ